MKKTIITAVGLLFTISTIAQTFNKAQGGATDVSLSSKGHVFVVGTSKQIFKYNFKEKRFKPHAVANRKAKTIAANGDWNYVLTTDGTFYKTSNRDTKRFERVGQGIFKDIYMGNTNTLWGISSTGSVREFNNGWKSFPIAGNDNEKVCVNNSGRVFTIKNNNTIWEYYNGSKKKLPGAATDIAYDHALKKLYVLGTSKRIFVWNPSRRNWDLVKNTRNDFKSISAYNGKLWGTTTRNEIYTTANITSGNSSNSNGYYKLKITLTDIECFKNGDGGTNPDDYYLDFYTDLTINNNAYSFANTEFVKIPADLKKVKADYLYLNYMWNGNKKYILGKEVLSKQEAAVVNKHRQLFARPYKKAGINNSGIYIIPKTTPISTSNSQFYVGATLDEITKVYTKTPFTRITSGKKKINLKKVINYLSGKISKSSFTLSKAPYYKMGTGYTVLSLDEASDGHRSMRGYFYGNIDKNGKKRVAQVNYTIELVD